MEDQAKTPEISKHLKGKVELTVEPGVVKIPGGQIDLTSCTLEQFEKAGKYLKPFIKQPEVVSTAPQKAETPKKAADPEK
jgi:hypothetical protein